MGEIILDKRLQSRDGGIKSSHRDDLVFAYGGANAADVRDPVVWLVKGKVGFFLTEGFHRYAAAKKLGWKRLTCVVKSGDWADAVMHAAESNIGHGLKRSAEDKRRCVELALSVHSDWSDRAIADRVAVSHPLVAEVRAEVEEISTSKKKNPSKPPKRKGRDGKSYPATTPDPQPTGTPVLEDESKPSIKDLHAELVKKVKFVPIRSKADDWLAKAIELATAIANEIKEQ
jgi:hypothetical protein